MFYVGQKVVCVDDSLPPNDMNMARELGIELPMRGSIYTVREIVTDFVPGRNHLRLNEIPNPVIEEWEDEKAAEPAFSFWRFRPLIERKTDISIFTAMLDPTKREMERIR